MTWFGDLLRESFKQFWHDLRDILKEVTDALFPDFFPFDKVCDLICLLWDKAHDLTVEAWGTVGQFIGDKTTERLDTMIEDAKNYILHEANSIIEAVRTQLNHKIVDLDERVSRLEGLTGFLQPLNLCFLCDVNHDGIVDMADISIIVEKYPFLLDLCKSTACFGKKV